MKSGMIIVDKEAGYTSFDVVARLRGILHEKKIGHMGTLDPQATGVLPVCIGKATKLIDVMEDHDKTYRAVMTLGITTDTYDMTGRILSEAPVNVSEEKAREVLLSMTGTMMQKPPMYSAVWVDGKRLYELARQGKTVDVPARSITVYHIEIEDINLPDVTFTIRCSKGTYIRSLVYDAGQSLGCGATLKSLRRTMACGFGEDRASSLAAIEKFAKNGQIDSIFIPIEEMLLDGVRLYASAEINNPLINGAHIHNLDAVHNGQKRSVSELLAAEDLRDGDKACIYTCEGRLCGLYEVHLHELKLVKFLLEK